MFRSVVGNARLLAVRKTIRLSKRVLYLHPDATRSQWRTVAAAAFPASHSEQRYNEWGWTATVGLVALMAGALAIEKSDYAYAEKPARQEHRERMQVRSGPLGLGRDTIPNIVSNVSQSVVLVQISRPKSRFLTRGIFGSPSSRGPVEEFAESGSGFFIDEGGLIITNAHVVAEAVGTGSSVEVTLHNGRVLQGLVLAMDPGYDIAIVRVKDRDKTFPTVKFGSSASARVGEWVLTVQCPLGEYLRNTVTLGILSGKDRDLDLNANAYDPDVSQCIPEKGLTYLQTDCALNPGASGSPLVNMDGEVIGLNSISLGGPFAKGPMGFSIPSDIVQHVVKELITHGSCRRPFVGLQLMGLTNKAVNEMHLRHHAHKYAQTLDQIARRDGRKQVGCLVQEISEDSPAAVAGLAVGDVILEVDGAKTAKVSEFLAETRFKSEQSIEVKVLRITGEIETRTIYLGVREVLSPIRPPEQLQRLSALGTSSFGTDG